MSVWDWSNVLLKGEVQRDDEDKCERYVSQQLREYGPLTKCSSRLRMNWLPIYLSKRVCFMKCQLIFSSIAHHVFVIPILINFSTELLLKLKQPQSILFVSMTSKARNSKSTGTQQKSITARIILRLFQHILGHGIWKNKLLIIACENGILSAFLSMWRMTFRAEQKKEGAIRINCRLRSLSSKSRGWQGGGGNATDSLSHTHTTHTYLPITMNEVLGLL